jgi:hypothetical protein
VRPGPDARLVSRPATRGWIFNNAVLLIGLLFVAEADAFGLALGGAMVALGLISLLLMARRRVWVDGDVLYSRALSRYGPPVRLDRLTEAALRGRFLWLTDADGAHVRLEARDTDLSALYRELAERLPSDLADERLRRLLDA